MVSRFLLLGEGETLGGKPGEAGRRLAQALLSEGLFFALAFLPCLAASRTSCLKSSRISLSRSSSPGVVEKTNRGILINNR